MPVEIGYVPAGTTVAGELGVEIPGGLPASTTDLLVAAPKTVSVLYAVLAVDERFEEADRILAAHHAGIETLIIGLNERASRALVYREDPRLTPATRLTQVLEAEPDAIPERREDLARQIRAELRDPAVVEHVESTGMRINQLSHRAHDNDRGDPHLHTHVFVDAEVIGLADGREYPRDPRALWDALGPLMQSYDYRLATALTRSLGIQMVLDERSGRREAGNVKEQAVASWPGTACVSDRRFHQLPAHRWLEPSR